jgi:hypothetical protein
MYPNGNYKVTFYPFLFLLLSLPFSALSQPKLKKEGIDTAFIADYHNELIARAFGSRKYTTYSLDDKGYKERLKYRPNSPFNVGVGFNYKLIGINLGFNLPIINDTKEYGKTKFIDLQTHVYGRKLIVDLYFQRYKGFYFPNTNTLENNNYGNVYIRPDLLMFNTGAEFQYLLNWKKFTFRGAFLHNEIQLKSAGSPIFGAYLGYISVRADSSLLPKNLRYESYFNDYNFHRSNIRTANLSIGYGYTLVLPYHFFITAAASGGFGLNSSELKSIDYGTTSSIGSNVSGTLRVGIGYNSRRVFAGMHYVGTRFNHNTPIQYARQGFGAGNFRVSVAHRFTLKKKLLGFY